MPFQKGRQKTGGKVVGSLNKETLNKLERRAVFEKEVNQMFVETIKKARPEYLLDQFLGKAPDKLEVDATVTEKPSPIVEALAERLNDILKTGYKPSDGTEARIMGDQASDKE